MADCPTTAVIFLGPTSSKYGFWGPPAVFAWLSTNLVVWLSFSSLVVDMAERKIELAVWNYDDNRDCSLEFLSDVLDIKLRESKYWMFQLVDIQGGSLICTSILTVDSGGQRKHLFLQPFFRFSRLKFSWRASPNLEFRPTNCFETQMSFRKPQKWFTVWKKPFNFKLKWSLSVLQWMKFCCLLIFISPEIPVIVNSETCTTLFLVQFAII